MVECKPRSSEDWTHAANSWYSSPQLKGPDHGYTRPDDQTFFHHGSRRGRGERRLIGCAADREIDDAQRRD